VKTSSDLLVVRSDLVRLTEDGRLVPERPHGMPSVSLDAKYFKTIDGFSRRFDDIPSLRRCSSFEVRGDVKFEPNVVIEGDVIICNPEDDQMVIPEGTVIKAGMPVPGES
jgi:UTP--glucose-1-phosphate uridylyltransferase